jgi:6-pyruvoyltetrahydropterin/6-carboxytetrahydropterin synthase
MTYKVVVEGGYLRFGASHFITMGGKCERLHGHNYDVAASVEGALGADSYVFDFVELKHTLRDICDVLDHRFLLPLNNPHLQLQQCDNHWEINFGDRRYVFPGRDVQPLPVDNVTAERLAEYIWGELADRLLRAECADGRQMTVSIGVAEAPGQTAWFTQAL